MSAKKMGAAERNRTAGRMAEYLDNYQASKKPKRNPKLVPYDWAKGRVVRAERAAHKKCFGLTGDQARENFDRIFRR